MARYIGATLNLKNGNFFTNMKSAVSAAGGLKGALGNTTTAMSKHGQQASATGTALKDLAKRAVGVVAAYASFSAVKNFMTDCVSLANEQAAAEQRLQTTMSNVAGTTQSQISSIKSYAAELQSLTTIGDEVAITGASQLATFQLQSDTIKTLMPAMEDLAVAQYGVTVSSDQMQSMANLVGKVMTGNVSALSRYGVVMDETQKKILQTGTESQKAAVLVDVLGQNFGGLAEAMANTPEGRIQQLKNAWGDMKEVIGAQLYPAITAILTYMTDKIPAVQSVLSGIMSGLQPIIGWAADIAIPTIGNAIGFVVQTVQGIYTACQPALSGLQDAFGRLGGAISGVFSGDGVSLIGSLAQTIFPVFINTVSGAANIVAGLVGIFGKLAPVILGVASAVGVYNAAVKIQNMLDTIRQGATKLLSAAGVANTATLIAMTGAEFAHTAAASAGSVATWALNSALAVLTSPITLVIAAIAALAAIFVVLWKKCDGLEPFT